MVRLCRAAFAAFLMFLRAALRCFSVAMATSGSFVDPAALQLTGR
jgi:hypothetical protein